MNRKKMKFVSIDPHHCTACWKCVEGCPEQVIGKVHFLWHKHVVIRNADACTGCRKCIKTCPHQVFTIL